MNKKHTSSSYSKKSKYFFDFRNKKNLISEYGLVSCFVHLNKHEYLAEHFLEFGGAAFLIDCLSKSGNDIQLIYYALLNVWMLSFVTETLERLFGSSKFGVIKNICDMLQKVSR